MATTARTGGDAVEGLRRIGEEVWGEGKVELIDELYTEDIVARDGPDTYEGRDAYRAWVESYRTAVPDMSVEMTELFGTDEFACGVFRITGTNTGPIPDMDMEPTGKEVDITGIAVVRFEDGKCVEEWSLSDDVEMMSQLGMLEAPTA
jgi:predicted ester cyclase